MFFGISISIKMGYNVNNSHKMTYRYKQYTYGIKMSLKIKQNAFTAENN